MPEAERSDPTHGVDPLEVCTLEPEALEDRVAWIRRELLPQVVGVRSIENGLSIELQGQAGVLEKVDRLIELERRCCGGIPYERSLSAESGRIRLEIRGIDPDATAFRALWDGGRRASTTRRAFEAIGGGVVVGLFVCCVLPLAAIALLGVAAEPLLRLDAPMPITAVAAATGGGLWWWLSRPDRFELADPCCGSDD